MITYKNQAEIEKIRSAGRVLFETMQEVKSAIRPGISTYELDQIAEQAILSRGGRPSSKGYGGFPASICASVDAQVVHGIPLKATILREGQIVSIDMTVEKDGYQADMARTYAVGQISEEARLFIERTRQSFYEGIAYAKVGYRLGDVSSAIQKYVESFGYGVVRALCGHGIGQEMHEDPEVPNFGIAGHGLRLRSGLVIAVEPMTTQSGVYEVVLQRDRWTYVTRDRSLAAHYENTICVTPDGEPEILTIPSDAKEDV